MTKEDFFKAILESLEVNETKEEKKKCDRKNCNTDPNPMQKICDVLNDFYNSPELKSSGLYKKTEAMIKELGSFDSTKYSIAKFKVKMDLDRIYLKLADTISELHQIRIIYSMLCFQQEERKK